MIRVFLIPGMGADKRIYRNIKLPDADVHYVDWFDPTASDTLSTYAENIISQYQITERDVVIGNSLGGMLAVEIANRINLHKVILISSIKTIDEAPAYFKWFLALPVYKIIPGKFMPRLGALFAPIFGKMYSVDAYLFNSMLLTRHRCF